MALLVPFGATLRHPACRDVLDGLEEVVGDSEAVAVANVGGVYELRRTAPRLGRLAELLRRAPFRGEDAEADVEAAHAEAIRALDAEDDALTAAAVAAAAEPPPHTPTKPRRLRHDRSGIVVADDDDNGPEGGDDATDDQGRAVAVAVAATQDSFAATADDLAPFRATDEGEDDLPVAVAAAHARRSVLARRHRTVAECTAPLEEAAALRTQNRFTLEELERVVQSSRLELRRALASLGAVSIGPFWRLLDEGFEHALLDRLLELILSQQWPPTRVPGRECVVLLGDVAPPTVVVHLLHRLGAPLSDDPDGDWALRWRAVARFRGHELLRTIRNTATASRRPAGASGAGLSALEALLESSSDAASAGSFRVRDFLATWRSAMMPLGVLPEPRALGPEDVAALNAVRAAQAEAGVLASGARLDPAEFDWTRVELGLALLRGLALETVARGESVVLYFPEHELPFDGPGRCVSLASRTTTEKKDPRSVLRNPVLDALCAFRVPCPGSARSSRSGSAGRWKTSSPSCCTW